MKKTIISMNKVSGISLTPVVGERSTLYSTETVVLLALGSLIQIVEYSTFQPLLIGIIFFFAGLGILRVPAMFGSYERSAYRLVFAVCWFWAGIAVVYANHFDDQFQNYSDAASFFALASGGSSGLPLQDIKEMTEGAGAVVVWRAIYDFFSALGFEKGRYIGIAMNVFLVTMSSVIGVKIVKTVFGPDEVRLKRFILLFSFCGIFWLFAAIHLRDACVLFSVSVLALFWVRYIAKPLPGNFWWLVVTTLAAFAVFGVLRTEFVFVPLAMIATGIAAMVLGPSPKGKLRITMYIFTFILAAAFACLMIVFQSDLVYLFSQGYESYLEDAQLKHGVNSLGMRFIVDAALPLRLLFGSVYLFVFPIPIWSGLKVGSAYYLFKSFQALFMYWLTPLVALAAWRIMRRKELRTPPILFLLFVVIGFTLSIAATSLETRHYGAFLVPMLAIATLPDLTYLRNKRAYKHLLAVCLSMMLLIHISWALLKVY